ncbi:MAG: DUF3891 family protein [Thermoanaerobaculia bacterium]
MIVRRTPQAIRHVTQADHARFASDLLRLVRLPELVDRPRRELLLRAVSEHDNGWWEVDAAPRLAPGGAGALDFRAFPAALRQEIWLRGIERFAGESPYVAALLAAHVLRLSERVRSEPSWGDFRAEVSVRHEELLEAADESPETLAEDDRWLAFADSLSLAICAGETGLFDLPGWQLTLRGPEDLEAVLLPFPFAGTTVFELSCRALEPTNLRSDSALGVALASSPWLRLKVRFSPS